MMVSLITNWKLICAGIAIAVGMAAGQASADIGPISKYVEAEAATLQFIDAARIHGQNNFYDPVNQEFVRGKFTMLHRELMQLANGNYATCAEFSEPDGQLLDVDFLLKDVGGFLTVVQTVIHKRGADIREGHFKGMDVLYLDE